MTVKTEVMEEEAEEILEETLMMELDGEGEGHEGVMDILGHWET